MACEFGPSAVRVIIHLGRTELEIEIDDADDHARAGIAERIGIGGVHRVERAHPVVLRLVRKLSAVGRRRRAADWAEADPAAALAACRRLHRPRSRAAQRRSPRFRAPISISWYRRMRIGTAANAPPGAAAPFCLPSLRTRAPYYRASSALVQRGSENLKGRPGLASWAGSPISPASVEKGLTP